MVIEFIGAPGSGKTTLVPTVMAWFELQGMKPFTIADAARPFASRTALGKLVGRALPKSLLRPALWQIFYWLSVCSRITFVAKHWRLMWHVVRSQKQRPEAADLRQRRVLYWYVHLIGYYEFLTARHGPCEAIVIDEGFIHRVVQLFASEIETPDPQKIGHYLDLVPKPDVVIVIRAPWKLCEQRIYQRGLWERSRHKNQATISQFVANAHQVVDIAIEHLQARGWPLILIDNEGEEICRAQEQLRVAMTQMLYTSDGISDGQRNLKAQEGSEGL